ncbi:MAG: hypothetical protein ACOX0T_07860 [Pelotomaculum sp.]|jgi:hypothetical protein
MNKQSSGGVWKIAVTKFNKSCLHKKKVIPIPVIVWPFLLLVLISLVSPRPVLAASDQATGYAPKKEQEVSPNISPSPADSSNIPYALREGQEVSPHMLKGAVSLSAGQQLLLDNTYNLFLSNLPEFPTDPGILAWADDALSMNGAVRVLFSHMNLLIDYSNDEPRNVAAQVGFTLENRTWRTLDIYAPRGSLACSVAPDGTRLFLEDAAPLVPGRSEPEYYGSAVGNHMIRQFYLSEEGGMVHLGRIQPGCRLIISEDVGPRGWAVGMYDLIVVDTATGQPLNPDSCSEAEKVGLATFIAPSGADLDYFIAERLSKGLVLPPGEYLRHHMRGLFVPGSYPNNPAGEATSKYFTINYSAGSGQIAGFALAAANGGEEEPDVFVNDLMLNGIDSAMPQVKGVNQGNYGAGYTIKLSLTGPVALVMQGATQTGFVDVYNQINTVWLDGVVKTVVIKDPNYDLYYMDFDSLREPGYGKVIGVFDTPGPHEHVLRFSLAPNSYGPVRFFLLPLSQAAIQPEPVMEGRQGPLEEVIQ